MKRFASSSVVCALLVVLGGGVAAAQAPGFDMQWSDKSEKEPPNHYRWTGLVELWKQDTRFYADLVDYWDDTHRLIATGNVTVMQPDSAISARSIDFNTDTGTGTFYNAWGMASLGNRVDRSLFGTLEPDMYFYGETIEKIGRKKYRITNGGFTTCVQPVPRWEFTSGSVVISLEHYAVLKNPVLRVKGVPLFYVPILYYPVKTKEDRATGLLMPIIGTSTLTGFSVSNAFFWAINRSQDLTVLHDLFTKTGYSVGTQYRYVQGPGSDGNLAVNRLNEHAVTTLNQDGTTTTTPARRSYQIRGTANQVINSHLRAGGSVSYFTDVVAQQTYNLNIYDSSRSQRTISANVIGSYGGYRVTGSFDRTEIFAGTTTSALTAATPRISLTRSDMPLPGGLPLYMKLGTEVVHLERVNNQSVERGDFAPTIRFPFTTIPFLTVNSSLTWHGTYWTRSWDAARTIVNQPISRSLFDMQSTITGPVVSRIFDTPDSRYAEKLKHTIEPYVTLRRTTDVANFNRIIQWESLDTLIGGTRVTYGLNNRVFAKRKFEGQAAATAREILNVGIEQTWYSNTQASRYDTNYSSSYSNNRPSNFSPVAMTARALPTDRVNATVRAEWNTNFGLLNSVTANAGYSAGTWLTTSGGWTFARSITAQGLVISSGLQHFLNGTANFRFHDRRYGGVYAFNLDVGKREFVQQRLSLYYNMQCCGFGVDYSSRNFGTLSTATGIAQDHRLDFSFTLAGIGSFSNFFGAMSGNAR